MRSILPYTPITFLIPSGGLAQSLVEIGSAVHHARLFGRNVVVMSRQHRPFGGQRFDEIFHLEAPLLSERRVGALRRRKFSSIRTCHVWSNSELLGGFPFRRRFPLLRGQKNTWSSDGFLPISDSNRDTASSGDWPDELQNEAPDYETAIYCALSVLRVRASQIVPDLRGLFDISDRFVGVHFRNSDRSSDFEHVITSAMESANMRRISNIYWATDDQSSIETARARCSSEGLNFHAFQEFQTAKNNLHFGLDRRATKRLLSLALFELFLLSESTIFVGSAGTWPTVLSVLRSRREVRESFFSVFY
jgi:hypothetical protein